MITDLQSDTAPEENAGRQTYRNLRQAWRYYHRNYKVDLAILYQLTDLLERSNPDRDAECSMPTRWKRSRPLKTFWPRTGLFSSAFPL